MRWDGIGWLGKEGKEMGRERERGRKGKGKKEERKRKGKRKGKGLHVLGFWGLGMGWEELLTFLAKEK